MRYAEEEFWGRWPEVASLFAVLAPSGRIRSENSCPLVEVFGNPSKHYDRWMDGIIHAADNRPDHDPAIRARLLAAMPKEAKP